MSQPAVSRILSAFARLREHRRDDHSSRPGIADGLKRPTRRLRTGRPLIRLRPPSPFGYGAPSARHRLPIWSCSVRGFACHLPYSRRGALLPHLFTLTPPSLAGIPSELRRGGIFSVPLVLQVAPTGRYPAHCPLEFGLSSHLSASDRLADCDSPNCTSPGIRDLGLGIRSPRCARPHLFIFLGRAEALRHRD